MVFARIARKNTSRSLLTARIKRGGEFMPYYKVKVTYTYPVEAISAEDALSTVPVIIKARFIGFHGEGITEILNTDGEVVLKAKLNNLRA